MVAKPTTIPVWLKLLLSQDTIGTVNSVDPLVEAVFYGPQPRLPLSPDRPAETESESPTLTMVGVCWGRRVAAE